ncbi:MAG TPA: hypothetical protein ENI44_02470 [Thermoplasmatales archaeon]|nr:hypothetical protein [Thermoplasmatales archaeon]
MPMVEINEIIFRAYDIRGVYNKDISPRVFNRIGYATGCYIRRNLKGEDIAIGNDIRRSSVPLTYAFISGVTSAGVNVEYLGTTSFGETLLNSWKANVDLISYITASHLSAEWNGVKFYYNDGVGLPEKELYKIRDYTLKQVYKPVGLEKIGSIRYVDNIRENYETFFKNKFSFNRKLRVAVDCGGGSTSLSIPHVFPNLGLDLKHVFCKPDPMFSSRSADPKPEHLGELIKTVREEKCDFGVAFDGDGDRSVIVDDKGRVLSSDTTGIIIGKYGLNRKGMVIANIECSKTVYEELIPLGFKIKQIPVGHTFLTIHAKKEKALLGIESSGHIIIPEYFLFDDAIIVPLKIAEILDKREATLSSLKDEIPVYPMKKEEIPCSDLLKFKVVEQLNREVSEEYDNVENLDGVRINLSEGWVLIRPSNTSPLIRLTVEANTEKDVDKLLKMFKRKVEEIIRKMG